MHLSHYSTNEKRRETFLRLNLETNFHDISKYSARLVFWFHIHLYKSNIFLEYYSNSEVVKSVQMLQEHINLPHFPSD